MKELSERISAKITEFTTNINYNVQGNKAAGVRARKNTLELEKMFKQYRKLSIEAFK